eukprot:369405-Prorocentrum_lima.AAC.1
MPLRNDGRRNQPHGTLKFAPPPFAIDPATSTIVYRPSLACGGQDLQCLCKHHLGGSPVAVVDVQ